jgi:RNA polymerase sigma factor (sigma-70 family)
MKDWKDDEKSLISACLKKDESAFNFLYQKNNSWLYSICLRYCKNKDDAQDLLQESFILIYRNLSSFNFEGSFQGWMRKITVNCILSAFRKKGLQFSSVNNNQLNNDPADFSFLQTLDLEELNYLINKLPAGRKQVFMAYAIDGFSHKEIAEMTGIAEGTSKSQLHDARKQLQFAIENEFTIAKN